MRTTCTATPHSARAQSGSSKGEQICQLRSQLVNRVWSKRRKRRALSVAGGLGFEPRLTESESAVLPLNYPPIGKSNQIRSGVDQASQAGPGSPATAADCQLSTQRRHIYGISRRFPSGASEAGLRAGKSCPAAAAVMRERGAGSALELGRERHGAGAAARAAHGDQDVLLLLLVEVGAVEHLPRLLLE